MREQTRLHREFQNFLDDIDILICPTAAVPPFPVEQLYCDEINGKKLRNYIQWVDIAAGITVVGHPVVQIPCGLEPTGTPFGLQIVGRRHSDRFVIGVAAALERLFQANPKLARPVPDIARLQKCRTVSSPARSCTRRTRSAVSPPRSSPTAHAIAIGATRSRRTCAARAPSSPPSSMPPAASNGRSSTRSPPTPRRRAR